MKWLSICFLCGILAVATSEKPHCLNAKADGVVRRGEMQRLFLPRLQMLPRQMQHSEIDKNAPSVKSYPVDSSPWLLFDGLDRTQTSQLLGGFTQVRKMTVLVPQSGDLMLQTAAVKFALGDNWNPMRNVGDFDPPQVYLYYPQYAGYQLEIVERPDYSNWDVMWRGMALAALCAPEKVMVQNLSAEFGDWRELKEGIAPMSPEYRKATNVRRYVLYIRLKGTCITLSYGNWDTPRDESRRVLLAVAEQLRLVEPREDFGRQLAEALAAQLPSGGKP